MIQVDDRTALGVVKPVGQTASEAEAAAKALGRHLERVACARLLNRESLIWARAGTSGAASALWEVESFTGLFAAMVTTGSSWSKAGKGRSSTTTLWDAASLVAGSLGFSIARMVVSAIFGSGASRGSVAVLVCPLTDGAGMTGVSAIGAAVGVLVSFALAHTSGGTNASVLRGG